jgi:hypothetical protein
LLESERVNQPKMVTHRMPITTAPYDHDENFHRFCMELLLHAVRGRLNAEGMQMVILPMKVPLRT